MVRPNKLAYIFSQTNRSDFNKQFVAVKTVSRFGDTQKKKKKKKAQTDFWLVRYWGWYIMIWNDMRVIICIFLAIVIWKYLSKVEYKGS